MRLWTASGVIRVVAICLASAGVTAMAVAPSSASAGDGAVLDARDAFRVRDRARLVVLRDALMMEQHPLAPWADFWLMQVRLGEVGVSEVDGFLARWGDAYVADRLRNDWLLELGRRRDWATLLRVQAGFRMNDDRDVTCLGVLARHQLSMPMEGAGDLREQARHAWWAQKEPDFGCDTMAQTLVPAGVLAPGDVWRKLRIAVDSGQPRTLAQSARLLGGSTAAAVERLMNRPDAFLLNDSAVTPPGGTRTASAAPPAPLAKARKRNKRGRLDITRAAIPPPPPVPGDHVGPLNLLALLRWASQDAPAAAAALSDPSASPRWRLSREETAWAWASIGRAAAWRLTPQAVGHFERALVLAETGDAAALWARTWPADTLAWMARAAIRSATSGQPAHWVVFDTAHDAMPPDQKNDPAWVYWKSRSMMAQAPAGQPGEARRMQARELLARIASPTSFYGLLASEDLNGRASRPAPRPARPTREELAQVRAIPGLDRGLRLYELGLRVEGAREWNYTLSHARPGGLSDRELLAAAELACDREIWDRCINTSERTRQEIDLAQRFPMPFKRDITDAAREVNLDPAYMFGLIRQESRFQILARSTVGASGLMQVMPTTAEWVAKRLGMIDYRPDLITDRDTNLKLGAGYLKLVLDDLGGSQPMAAAAYNAGPGRPRRWREGARVDAAAWTENIPFNETRDYVKKVVANAVIYGHLLHGKSLSIKARLGGTIGPRSSSMPAPADELP